MAHKDKFVTVVRKATTYQECVMCQEEFESWKQMCQGEYCHENGDDKMWSFCHNPNLKFPGWRNAIVFQGADPQYIALNGIPDDYTEDLIDTGLFSRDGVKTCQQIEYLQPVPCYENEQDFCD